MFFTRLFLPIVAVLVLLLSYHVLVRKRTIIIPSLTPLPTATLPSNPLSISALSRRSYDSQIVVEKSVRQTAKFTSQKISYLSDNLKLYALMNTPLGTPPDSGWPVVIVNHGHIEPKIYSTENSYVNTSAFYANNGFLVLKPDYRGHDQSAGEADTVASRINYAVDVLNLIYAAKKLPNINPDRIFLYGHSMGGDVSLRVLEICPSCVAAASLWAPAVTDFPESFLYFARKNHRDNNANEQLSSLVKPDEYSQVSSLANIGLVSVPLLIHHATTDQSVPYSWGQTLAADLQQLGKSVKFYSYPHDNHDIAANWSVALTRDIEFFRFDRLD